MQSSGYGLLEYVDGPGDSTNATCDTLPEISDNTKVYLGYNGAVLDNFIDVDPFTQGSFPATSPPPEANRTITLTLARELVRVWAMNKNTGWDSEREWQSPLLWDPREITNLTASAEPYDVVDLIMELPPPQPPHPIQ